MSQIPFSTLPCQANSWCVRISVTDWNHVRLQLLAGAPDLPVTHIRRAVLAERKA